MRDWARLALASKSLAKGVKMKTAVRTSANAEFAFDRVMVLAGGAGTYGDSTKASIWAECHNNQTIEVLAGRYLFSSFASAERSLANLDQKLKEVFGL